jgi:tripartite-type tricarboxylate transporter receptor subunit TctC
VLCDQTTQTLAQIKAKTVKLYGVTSAERLSYLPDTPTLREGGLKDFEITSWFGLFVPSSTPAAVVDKLHRETAKVLRLPDVQERFAKEGATAGGNAPAAYSTQAIWQSPSSTKPMRAAIKSSFQEPHRSSHEPREK